MTRVRWSSTALTTTAVLLTTAACGALPGLGGSDDLRTLAKVDGWREGFAAPPDAFAVLEVALDAETAQRMWDENIPAELPEEDGEPRDPGRYGDLADVDLDPSAVALWSGGESGSCPGWVSDVALEDGVVVVTQDADAPRGCSDDYRPFRVLVVVDRSDLPEASALATTQGRTSDTRTPLRVRVAAYPLG